MFLEMRCIQCFAMVCTESGQPFKKALHSTLCSIPCLRMKFYLTIFSYILFRGVQRLDKETVFGSEIRATFYKKKANKDLKDQDLENGANSSMKKGPSRSFVNSKKTINDEKIKNSTPERVSKTVIPNEEKFSNGSKESLIKRESFSNGILSTHRTDLMYPLMSSCNNTDNGKYNELRKSTDQKKLFNESMYSSNIDWPQVASNLVQNNIQNSNSNGIDLLVTNLDESVLIKDLKKTLYSLVREHSKATSVVIAGHGKENNLHAFVKVPKLQDAQLCIAKLNNQMLFNSRIHVTFASAKENALLKMKSEVSSVLLDTYTGWLPMNDFLLSFKDRYQHAFHVLNFDQLKDLVYVDGCPGFQFVCLLHFPVGLLRVNQGGEFEQEIEYLLKTHNRRVPFAR